MTINRAAIILRYKQKAVEWINEADPSAEGQGVTVENVHNDGTVYLVSDEDAEDTTDVERWIKRNYEALFEAELTSWYTDRKLWPEKRTFNLFNEWFVVECHTVVEDTVGTPIIIDDEG